ncbi:ectodysplasin-A-like isoform X2 [Acanthaster planci]|uniref:Ectodysplasin-A-like isoform X2 n=1 Tax=Acanthaster planci TaxID=133434 RepID=A0A8B7ZFC0_ACAPL|nr:ectodysplasin-A-like isoform X2 [Acanthaster planci]
MQFQRSWLFSLVVVCFVCCVTALLLSVALVIPYQSLIMTGALNSKLKDYERRISLLENRIVELGLVLKKTQARLHEREQIPPPFFDRPELDPNSLSSDIPLNPATTEESDEWIKEASNAKGDASILGESVSVQPHIVVNSKQDYQHGFNARWLRSPSRRRQRERPDRESKQCPRRCKGAKGEKGDVGPVSYGGEKGEKGERGPPGECECHWPTTEPETTYTTTPSLTPQYTTILSAHFEGDVQSIAAIARRDPINRGYVDLSEIDGGWVPYWRYAQWMDDGIRNKFILHRRGNVTVVEGGIYYVYSQMLYYDPSVFMGHSLYIGGQKRFSCTECTIDRDRKFNTCYIGGLVQINPGEVVGVKVSYANRVINLNPDSTHFGMIRLS